MNWSSDIAFIAAAVIVGGLGTVSILLLTFRRVEQGSVWLRSGMGGKRVGFSGIVSLPFLHKLERIDLTVKKIELTRVNDPNFHTQDNIVLHGHAGVLIRIMPDEDSVVQAAQSLGCETLGNQDALQELLEDRFQNAWQASLREFTWEEIDQSLEPLKLSLLRRIGDDLYGFIIDDLSFSHLAPPVDEVNIDARIAERN